MKVKAVHGTYHEKKSASHSGQGDRTRRTSLSENGKRTMFLSCNLFFDSDRNLTRIIQITPVFSNKFLFSKRKERKVE